MSGVLGKLVYQLDADTAGFTRGLTSAEGQAQHLKGALENTGRSFDGLSKSGAQSTNVLSQGLSVFSGALSKVGVAAAVGVGAAGVAVTAFGVKSVEAFQSFQAGMNEVFTLLPGISGDAMAKMSEQVKAAATDMGVLPEKVIPALYQALSAGIPPENVFAFLKQANETAVGGVSDLTTTVDALSSVVNSYGADVITAGQASDDMFTAVRLGKTTIGELSSTLSNVTPIAASLGVSFSDVTAALATMTVQGIKTGVATTDIRQALLEMSKDGLKASDTFKQIAGEGFKEFIAQGHNLQDAFQLMGQYAASTGVGINDLFGSVEAGQGALALTGQGAATFAHNLEEMGKSAGATSQAYDRMETSSSRSFQKLAAAWDVLKIDVGQGLAPFVDSMSQAILDHMPQITKAVTDFADSFGSFLNDQGPGFITLAGNIATEVGNITGKVKEIISVLEDVKSKGLLPGKPELAKGTDVTTSTGFTVPFEVPQPKQGDISFWESIGHTIKAVADEAIREINNAYDETIVLHKNIQDLNAGDIELLRKIASQHIQPFDAQRAKDMLALVDAYHQQVIAAQETEHQERGINKLISQESIPLRADLARAEVARLAAMQALDPLLQTTADHEAFIAAAVQKNTVATEQHAQVLTALNKQYGDLSTAQIQAGNEAQAFRAHLADLNSQVDGAAAGYTDLSVAIALVESSAFNAHAGLVALQQDMGSVGAIYATQASGYKSDAAALTASKDAINQKIADGIPITAAEQAQLDDYPALYARLTGGISDATIQEGAAISAKTDLMIATENLSTAIANGVTDLKPYNDEVQKAKDKLAGAQPASPLEGALKDLGSVMTDTVTPAINALIEAMGYLDKTNANPTVSLDDRVFATNEANASGGLDALDKRDVKPKVGMDNAEYVQRKVDVDTGLDGIDRRTAKAHAGLDTTDFDTGDHHVMERIGILDGESFTTYANLDTSQFDMGIQHVSDSMPRSPAKEGPLSIPPNWSYLTDGMGDDVQNGVAGGAELIAGYFPAGPTTGPTHGALAGGVDWSFIFAGIDKTAQDAGKQLEAAFTSTLGNLSDIASGATGKKLQDELTNLIDLKAIAIETNAGAAVVAEYDKQIAAKQAEINAIGVVMGTDIVQGIKSTIDAANILQGIEASVGKFNIGDIASGSALSQLQQQLSALQSTRAAVAELGLPQAVLDNIDAQIKQVEADITTVTELAGTSAAAIVKSQQDATAAFTASLGILSSGDPFKAAQDQLAKLHDLQTQVEEAILNPNIPPEVLAAFEQQAQQAADEYRAMQDTLKSALINGLIDPATLQAMAQAGGTAFAAFYDGIFGAGALEKLQAAWQQAAAIPLDELGKVLPSLADHGQALIDTLTGQVEDGSRSLSDAMAAISLIAGQTWHDTDGTIHHGTEVAIAELKKLEQELKVKLAEALVSGADPKQFEDNIALIEQLLADVSASVDTTAEAFHNAKQSVADFLNVFPRGGGKSIILNGQSFTGGGKGGLLSPVAPAIVDLDALLKLFQSAPDTIAQSMGSIVDAITAGGLSYKDALSLLTHATTSQVGQIVDSLHSLETQLQGQLAQAILDGTDPKKIKGLQAHLAEVEKLLAGVTGATGITGGSLNDIVSGLAGFHTTVDQLAQLIQDQALKTYGPANFSQMTDPKAITDAITKALGGTFADEQLALLKNIFTNPDLYPPALVDYIEKGLGKSLGTLDVSLSTQLGEVNKLLTDAGLKQLTPEEWKKMNETWQDKMLDTGSATIDSLGKVADGQADIGGRVSDGAELVRGQVDRAGSAIVDTLKDQFKHLISAESAIAAGNDPNAFNPFPPGGGGLKKGVLLDPGIADLSSSSTPSVDTNTMSTLGDNEGLAASIGRHVVGALRLAPDAPIMLDSQVIGHVTAQNFFKQQRQYATLINPVGRR